MGADDSPVGWAVDVAQIIQLIAELNSKEGFMGELAEILEDPKALLDDLLNQFDDWIDPGNLVLHLMMGDFDLSRFAPAEADGTAAKRKKTASPASGRKGRKRMAAGK